MSVPTTDRQWVPLTYRERRVLGVLVEKQKTTPEYYPMTIAAIVTGSNQKSNRDPITNFDADDVEEILQGLRKKGAVVIVEGTGRVPKWKHSLYDWFGLRNKPVEMAVLAELMLRGKQTEGDLRARAARMEGIADLDALQAVLKTLHALDLVVYLTPPGQKRGVMVTHNLYPPAELELIRQEIARMPAVPEEEPRVARLPAAPAAPPDPSLRDDLAALRSEVESLKEAVRILSEDLRGLKTSLGA